MVYTAYIVNRIFLVTTAKFIQSLCNYFIDKDGKQHFGKISDGKMRGLRSQPS